jgi:5'-3' exonuclease
MKPSKLVLLDYNNLLHHIIFNPKFIQRYGGITKTSMNDEMKLSLLGETLRMFINKILMIINYESNDKEFHVDLLFSKDSKTLWRTKIFSEYKGTRKSNRDKTNFNFDVIYNIFNKVWSECCHIFPYRFVTIDPVEVDDVIAIAIESEYDKYDAFSVYSHDTDFVQLLSRDKVRLVNFSTMAVIESGNPKYELFEKIIRGERGDNIPNIFNQTRAVRQNPISKKHIEEWFRNKEIFKQFILEHKDADQLKKNFMRNKNLIDFTKIPEEIRSIILVGLSKPPVEFDLQVFMRITEKYSIVGLEDKISFMIE